MAGTPATSRPSTRSCFYRWPPSTASPSAFATGSGNTWSRGQSSVGSGRTRRTTRSPKAESFEAAVLSDVRVGFERTIEQDIGFGIRQQTDIACKALSPAVNDPYTAVQALDHLSVVYCDLAVRPLGTKVLTGSVGKGRVVVLPGGTFHDYVRFISAAFGRYGSSDVIVMLALLRLFQNCVEVLPAGSDRLAVLDQAATTALADAERSIPRPTDLERIRAVVKSLRSMINSRGEVKPTSAT